MIEARLEIFESDGYLCASGVGAGIYTWARTWNKLMKNIREAVELYYDLPPKTEYTLLLEMKVKTSQPSNLDTTKMVEDFTRENSGKYKKKALWEHLPKKTMYQIFNNTFNYLLESGKIARDSKGYVIWIWNPEIVKKYLRRDDLTIR